MLTFVIAQLYTIALGALVFSGVKIFRAYKQHRYRPAEERLSDDELPTVSVCLPARNETNVMTECLELVLASDYPKLEVIVLDDNSSDNTPHLIKAFAHAGVRFVKGKNVPEDWLGKNSALDSLLHEASGKYVLFMDVDTRLSRTTIRRLIERALEQRLAMVSVIPQRWDMHRPSAWLGTLRYFWELVLHSTNSPGTASAAWLIRRKTLRDELGGFAPWRDEVQPEQKIARELAKTDEYALAVSTKELGVHYAKKWSSQIETGRRLLLPRFDNSVPSVMIGVGLVLSVLLPQVIGVIALIYQSWWLLAAELLLGALTLVIFVSYCRLVWGRHWLGGVLVAPFVVWQELWLLLSSAIGYQKGTITWKGRVVARPTRQRRSL